MTFYIGKKKNVNCSVTLNLNFLIFLGPILCCSKKKCRPKLILRLEIRNNTEMYVVCVLEEMTTTTLLIYIYAIQLKSK